MSGSRLIVIQELKRLEEWAKEQAVEGMSEDRRQVHIDLLSAVRQCRSYWEAQEKPGEELRPNPMVGELRRTVHCPSCKTTGEFTMALYSTDLWPKYMKLCEEHRND